MFDISLILSLEAVAYSDHRYFSMSVALISAVDNDTSSCFKGIRKTVRKKQI